VSMKIKTRQVDGITIMDCSGRITLGEGSVQLRDAVRDLLSKGSKQILLNLGDVTYIDSSGIGELVSAFTTVRKAEISSCSISPRRCTTCCKLPSSIPFSTSRTTKRAQ
jgi:anti-anti-sigma factor